MNSLNHYRTARNLCSENARDASPMTREEVLSLIEDVAADADHEADTVLAILADFYRQVCRDQKRGALEFA